MKRPSLWLAIGISIGAAIHDSITAVIIGVAIAAAPWLIIGLMHAWSAASEITQQAYYNMHKLEITWKPHARPTELDAFEYQRFYDTGELPERWIAYVEYERWHQESRIAILHSGEKVI